ncbi:MAG: DUF421 domain-containing protein [Oscillospiraceae bacterium]|nr:DUF421 domain-containing protein [Oscillospiraceae bacterium]
MAIVFIRSVILYALLIFSVRLMGKRQIGELQPSELAVTILISNIATLPIEDSNIPLLTGIIPILTLAALDVIMSWFGVKSRGLRGLTCGKPAVIISGGEIDQKKMRELRFSIDDLASALRAQGVFSINEVQFAVVETTGNVSVCQKKRYQAVTNRDIYVDTEKSYDPPDIVIDQGIIVSTALKRLNLSETWLYGALENEDMDLNDVFLMTASSGGEYYLVRNEE